MNAVCKKVSYGNKEKGFILVEIKNLQHNKRIAGLLPKSEKSYSLLDLMNRVEIRLKDPNTEKKIRDAIILSLPLLYVQIYLLKREA